jgi:bifunctional DNA-binding transcriptional regulator/antitoxin component of YhaV-PrlF toxin-antitoxin module
MRSLDRKVIRIGDSIGIVIPKETAINTGINVGDIIRVDLNKKESFMKLPSNEAFNSKNIGNKNLPCRERGMGGEANEKYIQGLLQCV